MTIFPHMYIFPLWTLLQKTYPAPITATLIMADFYLTDQEKLGCCQGVSPFSLRPHRELSQPKSIGHIGKLLYSNVQVDGWERVTRH